MTANQDRPTGPGSSGTPGDGEREDDRVTPLPGEPGIPNVAAPATVTFSRKGLFAVALMVLSLIVVAGLSIARLFQGWGGGSGNKPEPAAERPSAATVDPKRLDFTASPARAASSSAPFVPAMDPDAVEPAEPIGIHRSGDTRSGGGGRQEAQPEDAPVLLVSSRPDGGRPTGGPGDAGGNAGPLEDTQRSLAAYERRLRGLLDSVDPAGAESGLAGAVAAMAPEAVPPNGGAVRGSLFGGQLEGSTTPRVAAGWLGDRSLTLPKGTAFTCALKTKVISAVSGMVGCQVLRNVYGDDGRVLLIERGSHVDGEYRITSVRPGTVRVPVLWTRIRTPHGVTLDVGSPGTGQLGESGIEGHVDNRWGERIGAAMLLSLIDDSVQLVIQNQTGDRNADTVVLPSTTAGTSKLAEKVLDSTIGIPPLIYQNQGGIVGIYVARDVDFTSVYELQPTGSLGAR
ncbi:type IV secretion system protein VirB10 [Rubrivivax gelatinosus]|uniref:type IV secretion system protein VirB10 n=1 Tax=Rubrivivax gelatinosus TaxID=28068 RepID=UPI001903DB9F|nr:type IV secretion system protein VirB10 [Rubrivivax gelatinosus]MBK1613046.1 type IV secretion system protein VirB10 [Rubrivivax gelatinosus]MBZ8143140.1 type IV secretion system protein VirB10 [Rubrivivax gelatinosus]